MASSTGSNPEDEYADDEYADHDAEDREQPSVPARSPTTSPKMTCSNSARRSPTATTSGNALSSAAGGISLGYASDGAGPAASGPKHAS